MKRSMGMWLGVCGAMLLAGSVQADDAPPLEQASMLVTGHIEVATDGSVMHYALDQPDKLPAPVRDLLGKAIPDWKFRPALVNGEPVIAKTTMGVRVVATQVQGDEFRIVIVGTYFGPKDTRAIAKVRETAPHYPPAAVRAGVYGTVMLALRVDQSGKVADAAVEKVDLGVRTYGQASHWREVLGEASLRAAHDWQFTPATDPAATYRIALVPVTFNLRRGFDTTRTSYGQWKVYLPGPQQLIPWLDNRLMSGDPDAMPNGSVGLVGGGLHLLTPLHGA